MSCGRRFFRHAGAQPLLDGGEEDERRHVRAVGDEVSVQRADVVEQSRRTFQGMERFQALHALAQAAACGGLAGLNDICSSALRLRGYCCELSR